MTHIAIIGSGFGGLAAAIRLQARGFAVTVFEKEPAVGGRASRLVRKGYVFDTGPSLITAPFIIERVFAAAGRHLADEVGLVPLDPFYRIYFPDGSSLDYTGDPARMKAAMELRSPKDAARYDDFFRAVKPIYDAVITDGLGGAPFQSWKTLLGFLPRALRLGALQPVYRLASRYFAHEHHRFLFSFHPLFIGGSPFRAPAVYGMIPYLEREWGVWFARGGMYNLVEAMVRVFRDLGGEIRTGAEVEEIVVEGGAARGVRVGGSVHRADAVLSNGDVPWVYRNLIHSRHRRRWSDRAIDRLHISMSCFLLYLGVRKRFPALAHHTIILGKGYRDIVDDIFRRRRIGEDFSMYLHTPTRTDDSMAPAGCESIYVLVPVPHLGSGTDWKQEGPRMTGRVLEALQKRLALEGLRENIEVMESFTPEDFRDRLSAHLGSAFSIEPRLTQSAFFRPHNRSEDIRGLYFTGAGTHPGGGLPGVILSAEAAEKCILEDFPANGPASAGPHP
ncbi:MAG: phytoene desaturase family protein [Bacteroidota bacterium]